MAKRHGIIVDLDGTLFKIGDRSPFEEWKCDQDIIVPSVYTVLVSQPYDVIITSGRRDKYAEQTMACLDKHEVPYQALFMRRYGDSRQDALVKAEIYRDFIAPQWDIQFAIDDRPQVCRMWYWLGIPLFKVGDPDADF